MDSRKAGSRHIFRLAHDLGAIIVSETVKKRFEAAGVTGAVFASFDDGRVTVT
ncbi:imm11 family protein [Pseudomonas syringae]